MTKPLELGLVARGLRESVRGFGEGLPEYRPQDDVVALPHQSNLPDVYVWSNPVGRESHGKIACIPKQRCSPGVTDVIGGVPGSILARGRRIWARACRMHVRALHDACHWALRLLVATPQIKDIPDELAARIRIRAKRRHVSISRHLLSLAEEDRGLRFSTTGWMMWLDDHPG